MNIIPSACHLSKLSTLHPQLHKECLVAGLKKKNSTKNSTFTSTSIQESSCGYKLYIQYKEMFCSQ